MNALVICLWLLVLSVFCGPVLARSLAAACRRLRARGWGAVILAAAALIAATLYGGAKGTTNPPVGPRRAVYIRMIRDPITGRLHPVGAPLKLPEVIRE